MEVEEGRVVMGSVAPLLVSLTVGSLLARGACVGYPKARKVRMACASQPHRSGPACNRLVASAEAGKASFAGKCTAQ